MNKICHKCKKEKDISNFDIDKSVRDGYSSKCKICRRAYQKDYYKKNINKVKSRDLKQSYGISLDDKQKMINSQGNKCYICKKSFKNLSTKEIHVDHDHKSGKVRKILCHRCNRILGFAEENKNIFKQMILYLEEF